MSKRAKKSRDSGSSTKRSRSKGPGGGVKPMDYVYTVPRSVGHRGPEKKSVDTDTDTWNFDSTGTITLIGATSAGAGRWERVGRKLNYRSVHIKGCIRCTSAGAGTVANSFNRLVLVYDRQPNKNTPAISDILSDVTAAGGVVSHAMAGVNLNNSQRFLVLRDAKINLPAASASAPQQTQWNAVTDPQADGDGVVDWYVKLRDLPCEYAGDTAAIGSISSGALFLLSISDEVAANRQFVFRGATRTRYVDY